MSSLELQRSDAPSRRDVLVRRIRLLVAVTITYNLFENPIRAAVTACVDWIPAIDADRELRDGAEIAEITHLVDLSADPEGTRMIVRRERGPVLAHMPHVYLGGWRVELVYRPVILRRLHQGKVESPTACGRFRASASQDVTSDQYATHLQHLAARFQESSTKTNP